MPAKRRKKPLYQRRHLGLHKLGLFLVVFSVIGGGIMLLKSSAATTYATYPPHHAACTQNTATTPYNNSYARPGQRFTAQVKMKNDGTSNFSPNYGFILVEFNNGAATNYWKASGGTLAGDVTPGNTATFNLTVTAPSQVGSYGFNWAMYIIYNGILREPCTGKVLTVKNPPAASLNLNSQASNISLTQGAGLTLSWSASNGPTGCTASGSWSGARAVSGSENRSGDTATVGTKTYTLQCANQVGSGSSITRTVTVNAAPPPASPTPSPAPSTSSPKPSPTTGAASNNNPVPVVTTDTTPPSAPGNFQAAYNENVVDLRWDAATDDRGVSGYQLERSLDQSQWQTIGETINGTAYTDQDVNFQTTYYYRLRAIDESGNASANAEAQVATGSFAPNAKSEEALVLTSDDGVAVVTVPAGALNEAASCDLRSSKYLSPNAKGYASISGPYELLCKLASGSRVTAYAQPVTVQVILSDSQKKQYTDYKFYTRESDWAEIREVSADNSFVLGNSNDFALMGKTKKTPLWQKILITLFVIAAVAGAGLVGLTRLYRWRLKRQIEQKNRDNYNKERGY